jgi:hypothetical protein
MGICTVYLSIYIFCQHTFCLTYLSQFNHIHSLITHTLGPTYRITDEIHAHADVIIPDPSLSCASQSSNRYDRFQTHPSPCTPQSLLSVGVITWTDLTGTLLFCAARGPAVYQ